MAMSCSSCSLVAPRNTEWSNRSCACCTSPPTGSSNGEMEDTLARSFFLLTMSEVESNTSASMRTLTWQYRSIIVCVSFCGGNRRPRNGTSSRRLPAEMCSAMISPKPGDGSNRYRTQRSKPSVSLMNAVAT